jgi:thiol-disulfide isomerase/thioredoxin
MSNSRLNPALLIFVIFPVVGILGLILILSGDSDSPIDGPIPTLPPAMVQAASRPTVTPRPILNNPPPDITLLDMDGAQFSLSEFEGQPFVLNFWATWCEPCRREMPTLQRFARANPDVVMLAVTDPRDGQNLADIEQFLEDYHITAVSIGLDEFSRLKNNLGVVNLPMTYVLDAEGILRFRHIGEVTEEDLSAYIREAGR